MKLTFKNKFGFAVMSGKSDRQIVLKSISGLGVGERNYECINYYKTDGKTTLTSWLSSRVITMSGDIYVTEKLFLRRLMQILSNDGILTVQRGPSSKMIAYKPLSFEFTQKHGSIQSFICQIECDNPHFEDIFYTQKSVYTKVNSITTPFTLPCIFSTRSNTSTIVNNGDLKTYPSIIIASDPNRASSVIYTLTNKTLNSSLVLNINCEKDDKITINTALRTITNLKGENMIFALTEGAMGDFYLTPGENVIECICNDTTIVPNVYLTYKNNYLEAVL